MGALIRYWLSYAFFRKIMLRNVEIETAGIENLPKSQGFIIASNHSHSWDPMLLSFAIKRLVHFFSIGSNFTRTLSKNNILSRLEKLIFRDSLPGFYQRSLQQIPISYQNRGMNKTAFLNAAGFLKAKEIIGIFPEGILSLKKRKIFPGAAILAKQNNAKIVPAYIETNAKKDSFPKPNFTKVKIIIGKPMKYSKSVNETTKSIMKEIYRLK